MFTSFSFFFFLIWRHGGRQRNNVSLESHEWPDSDLVDIIFCIMSFRVMNMCILSSILRAKPLPLRLWVNFSVWSRQTLYYFQYIPLYISYFMLFIRFLLYTILFFVALWGLNLKTWFDFKELNPSAIVHWWHFTLLSFRWHLDRNVTHHSYLLFP